MSILTRSHPPRTRSRHECFGDAYTSGQIEVDGDLVKLMVTLFQIFAPGVRESTLSRIARWCRQPRRNTLAGSRDNIHQHYDIGNEFYGWDTPWHTLALIIRVIKPPSSKRRLRRWITSAASSDSAPRIRWWKPVAAGAVSHCTWRHATAPRCGLSTFRASSSNLHAGEPASKDSSTGRVCRGRLP